MTDDNVTQFPGAPANDTEDTGERELWVCGCGCMTFYLRLDGKVECSNCEQETGDDAGWTSLPEQEYKAYGQPFSRTNGIDQDFIRQRWAQRIAGGEFIIAVGLAADGHVSTYAEPEVDKTDSKVRRSILRNLRAAYQLIMDTK